MERFELSLGFLPPKARVVAFLGHEAIDEPYRLEVYVSIPDDDEQNPIDALRSRATLTVNGTADRIPEVFHGVVTRCERIRSGPHVSLWLIVLGPEMGQLALGRDSRVFTHKTVKDACQKVFEDAGFSSGTDFELEGAAGPTEEHLTQYRESDFAFFERWAARRGWYYFYDHSGDREKLRVVDGPSAHEALRSSAIPYRPGTRDASASEHWSSIRTRKTLSPRRVKVGDYNYQNPSRDITGTGDAAAEGVGELVYFGARVFDDGAASSVAKFRAEAWLARERTVTLKGFAHHVAAGALFTTSEHTRADLNGEFLVLQVERFGRDAQAAGEWGPFLPRPGTTDVYEVDVVAIPKAVQFRGAERPWPSIFGTENAVIEGPAESAYAQLDRDGRYYVKFHFDRGSEKGDRASTRVRMMQPHGGGTEGFHLPLRKGTEVICAFFDGDPDRPAIVGAVPNATKPSVVVQSNAPQNVLQTGSQSYLTIDDTSGAQWANLFSPNQRSGLYLGAERGAGQRAVTSADAPHVEPDGPGALDLNSFSVDLRTDGGSGRVHSGADLNIQANARLQTIVTGTSNINHMDTVDFDTVGAADEHLHDTLWHHTVGATVRDHFATFTLDVTASATYDFSATWSQTTVQSRKHKHCDGYELVVTGDTDEVCLQPRTLEVSGGYTVEISGNLTQTQFGNQDWTYGSKKLHVKGNYYLTIPSGNLSLKTSPAEGARKSNLIKIIAPYNYGPALTKTETMSTHIEVWRGLHLEFCALSTANWTGLSLSATKVAASATGLSFRASPIIINAESARLEARGPKLDLAGLRILVGSYLFHPHVMRTV